MYQVYTYTVSELYSLFDNGRIKLKAPSDRTLSNEHARLLLDGIFCGYPIAPLVIIRGTTELGEPVIKVLQGAFVLSVLLGYRKGSIRSKGYLSFKSVSERSKNGDRNDFIRIMNYDVPVIALSDAKSGEAEATLRLMRAMGKHE
jgi:hypothetical protein